MQFIVFVVLLKHWLVFQAAVLLGEVNAIWPAFRKQVKDPFLTDMQNRELQRRITVSIIVWLIANNLSVICFK